MKPATPVKANFGGVVYHLGNEQLDAVRKMSEPELVLLMAQIDETHVLWRECVKRLKWLGQFGKDSKWKE